MREIKRGKLYNEIIGSDAGDPDFKVIEIEDPDELKGMGTCCGESGNKAFSPPIIAILKQQAKQDEFEMYVVLHVSTNQVSAIVASVGWLQEPLEAYGGSARCDEIVDENDEVWYHYESE